MSEAQSARSRDLVAIAPYAAIRFRLGSARVHFQNVKQRSFRNHRGKKSS
jgi:hypothetical protein